MPQAILKGDDLVDLLLAGYKPTPVQRPNYPLEPEGPYDCQACGACCVEAGTVPIYPDETGVPETFAGPMRRKLDPEHPPGMRQIAKHMGGRCKALAGEIGACVSCTIYDHRPRVCAAFVAGSEGCKDARLRASQKMLRPEAGYRGYGRDWEATV